MTISHEFQIGARRVTLTLDDTGAFTAQWQHGPPDKLSRDELDAFMNARAALINELTGRLNQVPGLGCYMRSRWL